MKVYQFLLIAAFIAAAQEDDSIIFDEKSNIWVRKGKENIFDADINTDIQAKIKKCIDRHPLILIPGVGGSRLWGIGTVDKSIKMNSICSREFKKWEKFWMRWDDALPIANDCFMTYLTLEYKEKTQKMGDLSNLTIIPPEFGKVLSLDRLSDSFIIRTASKYYHDMIAYFENYGWKADYDILGAPYDWRKMDIDIFHYNLSNLIIETSKKFGKEVDIVTHSMGGLWLHLFFKSELGKKAKPFVHNWHAFSTPWTGAVKMLRAVLSGDNFHLPTSDATFLPAIRTMDGAYSLVPNPDLSLYRTEHVVEIAGRRYTAKEYNEIMKIANISRGMEFINTAFNKIGQLTVPDVPFRCYYTTGSKTMRFVRYKDTKLKSPAEEFGDGDGTVNLESLQYACDQWKAKTYDEKGPSHVAALRTTKFLDAVLGDSCAAFEL